MTSKRKSKTAGKKGSDMSRSSAAVSGTSKQATTKQRQTSLRNFFGLSSKATTTVSFREQHDRKRTADSYPMTPPTPVSPNTPQTQPTPQTAPEATPATPHTQDENVQIVIKRARSDETGKRKETARPGRDKKKALEQTYLDLGQRDFGKRTICSTCGMLYVHGLNEDSEQHSRICHDYLDGVSFNVPQARVVASDSLGSIVEIRPTDSYALRTKLKRVREIVDRDLGFVSTNEEGTCRTAFLFVVKKRVVGMATAEIIQCAFLSRNSLERSSDRRKAMVGVHQLWVHAKFGKQGVATRLVDAIREKLVFGLTVPKDMLAFSSPTEAGSRFARSYVNHASSEILVYDCS